MTYNKYSWYFILDRITYTDSFINPSRSNFVSASFTNKTERNYSLIGEKQDILKLAEKSIAKH